MSNTNIRLRVLPKIPPVDGRPVEMQVTDTFIQWRLQGDPTWTDLIALSELQGPPGASVEIQSNGFFIQYRVVGTPDWIDIVSLEDLRGPAGFAATVTVGTVTTVDAGDPATVTNSGTSSAAILDFEIPEGPAGPGVTDGDKGGIIVTGSGATWRLKDGDYGDIVVSGGGTVLTLDQVISEAKVVPSLTDALRVTIINLAYAKIVDRAGDPAAATANTAAINAALASKRFVELGEGDIRTNAKISIGGNRRLIGCGENGQTTIKIHSTTDPAIEVAASVGGVHLQGFQVDRVGVPTGSAHGLNFLGYVDESCIEHVYVRNHRYGMLLGGTGYSTMRDCRSDNNYLDGVRMTNSAISSAVQWYIDGLLLQTNDGSGLACVSQSYGPASQLAIGDWNGVRTFANTGAGVSVQGISTVPVIGVRMRDGFIGGDGLAGIAMNTFGRDHFIWNSFFEYAADGTTGRNLATAKNPSGAEGAYISDNNADATFSSCIFYANTKDGLYSLATGVTILEHCTFRYNTGRGAYFGDGAKAMLDHPVFISNTGGNFSAALNLAQLDVQSPWPKSVGTRFTTGVALGNPTGGIPIAGRLNSEGTLNQNNVAFNNP